MCRLIGQRAPPSGNKPPEDIKGTQRQGAWAICITPGPRQVLYSADAFQAHRKMTLDGKLLGVLGGPKNSSNIGFPEIAWGREGTSFMFEVLNWRVQKLLLHPGTETAMLK
jgi:hypothetical protein